VAILSFRAKKHLLLEPLSLKPIVLPRQARDKHRKAEGKGVFLQAPVKHYLPCELSSTRLPHQVRKRHFCAIYMYNALFYQDKLGTNIGKEWRFLIVQPELHPRRPARRRRRWWWWWQCTSAAATAR
jgi:hypothetical protein